jgi:hypothetical protein
VRQPAKARNRAYEDVRKRLGFAPPTFDDRVIRSLQAIDSYARTQENPPAPEDCRRALDWIIQIASQYYTPSFTPEKDGVTNYFEGRRSVGHAVVTLLGLKAELFQPNKEATDE